MRIESQGWTCAEHLLQVQINFSIQVAQIVGVFDWIADFEDCLFLVFQHPQFVNILVHELIVVIEATDQLLNLKHRESFVDALVLAILQGPSKAIGAFVLGQYAHA